MDRGALSATFSKILQLKRHTALVVQDQLLRNAERFTSRLDDIARKASATKAQTGRELKAEFQRVSAMAMVFVSSSDQALAKNAPTWLKYVETSLVGTVSVFDGETVAALKDAHIAIAAYRSALEKAITNAKMVDELATAMERSAAAIVQGATAMKSDLLGQQQRLKTESETSIGQTKQLILILAGGSTLIGAVLAILLGTGISRPMIAMCKAVPELASGDFDVVLPGLGRKDEIGEMAGAVEEFKLQAIAKSKADAMASEAQSKQARASRRAELIRFANDFEAAVGAIVSNVSASSVQLESAASTLTRTAETTQNLSLSSQVAGVSQQTSANMKSVATATEELSASVDEIGRQVRDSSRIAEEAVAQAKETDDRIGKLSHAAQQIGHVVK